MQEFIEMLFPSSSNGLPFAFTANTTFPLVRFK